MRLRYAPFLSFRHADDFQFRLMCGSDDPVERIAYIADLGFTALADQAIMERPGEERRRVAAELRRRDIMLSAFSLNGESSVGTLWASRGPEAEAAIRAEIEAGAAVAAEANGRLLNITSGFDPRMPRPYQLVQFTENLKRAAPLAEKAGMVLAVEATSEQRAPNMLMPSLALAYQVVRAVDHPSVKLMVDLFHTHVADGDIVANVDRVWEEMAHIQIGDAPGRIEPGAGEINWPYVLGHLLRRGYDGLVELEFVFAQQDRAAEQRSLDLLHAIDRQLPPPEGLA